MRNLRLKIKSLGRSDFYYNKSGNFCLRVPPEALFYWKLLKIGLPIVKDIRKDVTIFQVWQFASAPPTPPVFLVVLLHTEAMAKDFLDTKIVLPMKEVLTHIALIKKCRVNRNNFMDILWGRLSKRNDSFAHLTRHKTISFYVMTKLLEVLRRETHFFSKKKKYHFTYCHATRSHLEWADLL